MFDREAVALQQAIHVALCSAACIVQKSFLDALEVVDRSSSLSVEHWKCYESAKPRHFFTHFANCEHDRVGQRLRPIVESFFAQYNSEDSACFSWRDRS